MECSYRFALTCTNYKPHGSPFLRLRRFGLGEQSLIEDSRFLLHLWSTFAVGRKWRCSRMEWSRFEIAIHQNMIIYALQLITSAADYNYSSKVVSLWKKMRLLRIFFSNSRVEKKKAVVKSWLGKHMYGLFCFKEPFWGNSAECKTKPKIVLGRQDEIKPIPRSSECLFAFWRTRYCISLK